MSQGSSSGTWRINQHPIEGTLTKGKTLRGIVNDEQKVVGLLMTRQLFHGAHAMFVKIRRHDRRLRRLPSNTCRLASWRGADVEYAHAICYVQQVRNQLRGLILKIDEAAVAESFEKRRHATHSPGPRHNLRFRQFTAGVS